MTNLEAAILDADRKANRAIEASKRALSAAERYQGERTKTQTLITKQANKPTEIWSASKACVVALAPTIQGAIARLICLPDDIYLIAGDDFSYAVRRRGGEVGIYQINEDEKERRISTTKMKGSTNV